MSLLGLYEGTDVVNVEYFEGAFARGDRMQKTRLSAPIRFMHYTFETPVNVIFDILFDSREMIMSPERFYCFIDHKMIFQVMIANN